MRDDPVRADTAEGVDWTRSLRLVALAFASAVLTATLVIVIGGAWIDQVAAASRGEAEATSPMP